MALDLRAFARDFDGGCMVRVPGVCVWRPTCLAHLRVANVAGVGQKPPDLCGVISCDSCHGVIDGKVKAGMMARELDKVILDALVRTLSVYERSGLTLAEAT